MGNDLPDYQSEVSTTLDLPYLPLTGGTMSGQIAMGTNKITGLAAPSADGDAARKLDVDTVDAKLNDVTVSQPSRSKDVVYQNTSGKLLLVIISVALDASENARVFIGAANPPLTQINDMIGGTGGDQPTVTFIVPPSYYYKLTEVAATITIIKWTECVLL